jgi:hypothetical protein
VGHSGKRKNVSLTACTSHTKKPGSTVVVFVCRKNCHISQQNNESFNERQDHMEPTYVLLRDENSYIF